MRKKYLSALLFGALLFASAGTFTSCKDYDDDINNLQEQINTVVSDLASLKSTVDNLGGYVTDVKVENGKLVVTIDNNTVSYDLPAGADVTDVKIENGHLYVNDVDKGEVGSKVTVNEEGELLIDGNASGLKVGTEVIIKDSTNGIYTISINGQTIQLPMASSTISVTLSNFTDNGYCYFTNNTYGATTDNKGGIVWGKASKYNGKWAGLKSVTKDALLVGPTTEIEVNVSPATFDLSTTKLTLVNTLGETAPVTVTPVITGKDLSMSGRAASADGIWKLQIAMDETVTLDNIATAFATKNSNNDPQNVNYALAVDGRIVTPYRIVVDTQEKAEDEAFKFDNRNGNTAATLFYVEPAFEGQTINNSTTLPLGEVTLDLMSTNDDPQDVTTKAKNLDKVYDAYIELTNKDLVDSKDITVSGMTIKTTDKAAALSGVTFKVHVLDVMGNETVSKEYTVNFTTSTVTSEAIADQTYTIMPTQEYILVDLGNTFTSLTAEQAETISGLTGNQAAVNWEVADGAKTLEGGNINSSDITYYASENDAKANKNSINVANGSTSTIRTIKYAKISLDAFAETKKAEAGDNKVTITLKDKSGNEIKKVTATVTIALPSFDDVISANTEYALWDNNTFTTRMKYNGDTNGQLPIENAFISKKNVAGVNYLDMTKMTYEVSYIDDQGKEISVDPDNLSSLKEKANGVATGKLLANEFTAEASIEIFDGYEKLLVSKEFTVKLLTLFEGAKVVYYDPSTNSAVDIASLPADRKILTGTEDKGKKSGLFITIDKYEVPFKVAPDATTNFTVGGYTLANKAAAPTGNMGISYQINKTEGSAGTPKAGEGYIIVEEISAGESGAIIFNYTDKGGITTSSELKYKL